MLSKKVIHSIDGRDSQFAENSYDQTASPIVRIRTHAQIRNQFIPSTRLNAKLACSSAVIKIVGMNESENESEYVCICHT